MSDQEIGFRVLKSFHRWSAYYNKSTFKLTYDQFLKALQPDTKKLNILADGLGGGVREVGLTDKQIDDAMSSLAITSRGRIPSRFTDFFNYLQNEGLKINWIDAAAFTVKESAKDVLSGAESVGKSLILSGKILNFILPGIVIFYAFHAINKNTGGDLAKVLGAFKK